MALTPTDPQHEKQIEAGIRGRNYGHQFEEALADDIERYVHEGEPSPGNLSVGRPADLLARYVINNEGLNDISNIDAWWVGGRATGAGGHDLTTQDGSEVGKSKSDVVVEIDHASGVDRFGVSAKTCSAKTPTNAQLFFTTASSFCGILRRNGVTVTETAEKGMKMFCGDDGYRPFDMIDCSDRMADERRWFWEEMPDSAMSEWESILKNKQNKVTRILLQKAYKNDPYPPKYMLHKTKKSEDVNSCEVAIYSIDEFIRYSSMYNGYATRSYGVHKGTYSDDPNTHKAPRFGFIQFQRGGQKQHPTQLQFNLKSGYFYKIEEIKS